MFEKLVEKRKTPKSISCTMIRGKKAILPRGRFSEEKFFVIQKNKKEGRKKKERKKEVTLS